MNTTNTYSIYKRKLESRTNEELRKIIVNWNKNDNFDPLMAEAAKDVLGDRGIEVLLR